MKRAFALLTTALMIGNPIAAFAAPGCNPSSDQGPLKTAAMQQELMVAALRCHDVNEYNQFVLSHQNELINSDNALKAYFQRDDKQRGTATYNKYKTELANAASLQSSQDLDSFCGAAAREFDFVLQPASLAAIVARVELIADVSGANCPVVAANTPNSALAPSRPPYAGDRETAMAPSDSDEDWNTDDSTDDFDNNADDRGEPDDLAAPAPHSMIDENGGR